MSFPPILRTEQITIRDLTIEVQRKAIKRINLRVYPPDGRVYISAPLRVELDTLRQFAISKLAWIDRQRAKFQRQDEQNRERSNPEQQNQDSCISKTYRSGEIHYYRGQPYCLQVHTSTKRARVELDHDTLHLYIQPNATIADREHLLNYWYRQQLKALIPAIVAHWEPVMGVRVNEWRIKRMKTRWGTCNIQARRIWFNLALIKAPPHCLEYVVVHEMTHLLERLHNDRFHRLLDRFLPAWKGAKRDLNVIR